MTRSDKSKFEGELRFDDLIEAMPTNEERDFYRRRQELGKGVGLDENGNLINATRPTSPS